MTVTLLHKRNDTSGVTPNLSSIELGELAINTYDGKLFIKKYDGFTEQIVSFSPGGNFTVSEVDTNDQDTATYNEINTLKFDSDSGFAVTNLGNGAVKIAMNSTFKFWHVDGEEDLIATGLDHVQFVAGNGIIIETDSLASPYQQLIIKTPPKTVQLFQEGFLDNTTGTVRWYAPGSIKIQEIVARIAQTSDVNITININKSGNTAETISLNANSDKVSKITNIVMNTDDFLTVDLVMTGNSTGRDLSLEFFYVFE
jgi:hypothetical protein